MEEQSETLRRALAALSAICGTSPAPEYPESTKAALSGNGCKPGDIPPADPEEWRGPVAAWLDSRCVNQPRWFSGVNCLHIDFCDWEIARKGVPCSRATFVRILEECCYLLGEVSGATLVSGLALAADVKAFEQSAALDSRTRGAK